MSVQLKDVSEYEYIIVDEQILPSKHMKMNLIDSFKAGRREISKQALPAHSFHCP